MSQELRIVSRGLAIIGWSQALPALLPFILFAAPIITAGILIDAARGITEGRLSHDEV